MVGQLTTFLDQCRANIEYLQKTARAAKLFSAKKNSYFQEIFIHAHIKQ
jgi:hypothetical protein